MPNNSGMNKDKTMAYKLMYNPNFDAQITPTADYN